MGSKIQIDKFSHINIIKGSALNVLLQRVFFKSCKSNKILQIFFFYCKMLQFCLLMV
jgi:hypothetical protein